MSSGDRKQSSGVGNVADRRQKHRQPVKTCGVGTSSMDTVEGISHRPGQEGDSSHCSDMKEWGCGLWTRVGEKGSSSWCALLLLFEVQSFLQSWGIREQDMF